MMETFLCNCAPLVAAVWAASAFSVEAQVPAAVPVAPTNRVGAHIQFAALVHDFGKISSSSAAKHDYVFTNTGNARLEISDVRTSCGCATAGAWPRQVEPGQTGAIPIQLNTTNLSVAGPILKTISVTCNDSNQPMVMLQLKATIWKPIDVNPLYTVFNLQADSLTNETKTVRIVNYTDQPLILDAPECGHKSFSADIKTVTPGKEFELLISAVPPFSGNSIQGPVTVKTSSTNLPVISVNAIAIIQPAIAVMPNQIALPGAPLPPNTKSSVTIRINGPTNVTITEPAVNFLTSSVEAGKNTLIAQPIPGVNTRMQELQPGRFYNIMISFPDGFEIRSGQKAELSLKTSHPRYPCIRVPIYQVARPSPAAASAPPQAVLQAKVPPPSPRRTDAAQSAAPQGPPPLPQ